MIRAVYWGYSDCMLRSLYDSKEFELCSVFTNDIRVSKFFIEFCHNRSIKLISVSGRDDLTNCEDVFQNVDVIIMYKFEFIIPIELISRYRIINFHGGNLRTNRGAHAIVWSILHSDKNTCLSMYQLTGGIDEGILIDEYDVEITEEDDPDTVNNKLQYGIPILLQSLIAYLNGNIEGVLTEGGTYHAKIQKKDFILDVAKDSLKTISAKIRSQRPYLGAILIIDDIEYRVKEFTIEKKSSELINRNICYKDDKVVIEDSQMRMILKILRDEQNTLI